MAHTDRTLALNANWDISTNDIGEIVLVEGDTATEQNVANECRLFTNDDYFRTDEGIPYFDDVLGQQVNEVILRTHLTRQAYQVENVAEVTDISFSALNTETREISGSIKFRKTGDSENDRTAYF